MESISANVGSAIMGSTKQNQRVVSLQGAKEGVLLPREVSHRQYFLRDQASSEIRASPDESDKCLGPRLELHGAVQNPPKGLTYL
jgi:hypothetical protein